MRIPVGLVALALAVTGCAATAPTSASSSNPAGHPRHAAASAAASAANWPAYHLNAARTGDAAGLPAAGALSQAWHTKLDGTVYGQPLVIGGTVIAATERNSVYGLAASNGAIRWRTHLGTPIPLSSQPCGDIDPLGITGTPVYDRSNGLVYAVANTTGGVFTLAGISAGNGHVAFRRTIPAPDGHRRFDQQRSALTLDRGRVYVTFGGHDGDCGPYRGSIVGVAVNGQGPLVSYVVPTAREAGMWAPGGPVVGPTGTLYVSAGNGAATSPPYDGSDSVTARTPALHRTGIFAPSTWASDNASDQDLGSSSPALLKDGKLLADGKSGISYLLNASHLAGVGTQLTEKRACAAFGGMSVSGTIAYLPCVSGGTAAVDTAGGKLHVLWRGPQAANGAPVVGGGAVWVLGWPSGVLYELNQANGHVKHKISLGGALPHFASPSLYGKLVLIGTTTGVTAIRGA